MLQVGCVRHDTSETRQLQQVIRAHASPLNLDYTAKKDIRT